MYRYYMTQRPAMPGAMPRQGLDSIEDLDPRDNIPYLGRGAYSMVTYVRKLTDEEVRDYELTPYDEDRITMVDYKGYMVKWDPFHRVYEIFEPAHTFLCCVDTIDEAKEGIDMIVA